MVRLDRWVRVAGPASRARPGRRACPAYRVCVSAVIVVMMGFLDIWAHRVRPGIADRWECLENPVCLDSTYKDRQV